MMHFMLLFSRQGKLRLQKWFVSHADKIKKKIIKELLTTVLSRKPKMSSFLEWKDKKVVYKRYASLYFCCCIDKEDNELLTLEIIHRYVELLDKYFGNVCELDIIFNFEKAYFVLDEFILGGEVQDSSKKGVLSAIGQMDLLQEDGIGGNRSNLEDEDYLNERSGIPVEIIQQMETCVEIPQEGMIRSLNVHVSGALLLWEYHKQTSLGG